MIYTLTDGFPDQFGGPKRKKFKYKQLEELLLKIAHDSMHSQKERLNTALESWQGDLEQVDDICIIGIRI
jgi:serine phosphatase RsbU (regulator of sigma subunit)